jgi:putative peptidoglycan lipid II flippase
MMKWFGFLNKEFNGLHESAFLLGLFALFSQFVAVARDRLFAAHFGAGAELDIYYAAFRIPDLIFVSIASFVAITVIMPFFVDHLNQSKESAQDFISSIFTVFFIAITAMCLIIYIFAPWLVNTFYDFPQASRDSIVVLMRILLLSPILLGISNIFATITQTFKNFLVYAISPILYNVGIVLGLVFFYSERGLNLGIPGLAYGVILGALLHVGIQIPTVIHHGYFPRFAIRISFKEIKKVFWLALPRTLGLSAGQISLFVLTGIASSMAIGSVAIFQLAFNLQSVPLSIVGVSYSVAAFPMLSKLYSRREMGAFSGQVMAAFRHIVFWSLPITFLFIVLRAQIVRTILGAGHFGWNDTRLTAAALAIFSVSVVAQSLILLLVRGYYAAGRTYVPVVINVLSAFLIIGFAYFFNFLFATVPFFMYFMEALLRVDGASGSNMLSLPLAYSIGMVTNVLVLWFLFKRDFKIEDDGDVQTSFRQSLYCSVIMGFVAYCMLAVFDKILNIDTFMGVFLQGAFSGVCGILAGGMLLYFMHNKETKEIVAAMSDKFKKAKLVLPDVESF